MRTSILATAVLAIVLIQSGCSQLPERPNWMSWNSKSGSPGLPSPDATIASSEKKAGTKSPPKQSSKNDELSSEISRGKSFEINGKPDKARKVYEAVLKQNPNNPDAAHALGVLLDNQGKHTDAEQCLLVALQQQPRNPELLNDLGFCYMQQGRLDSAESALIKATTLDSQSSRYRNNLGLVLGHQKRYDDAFEQFSKTGSEADAFYNMAFVFASQDLPEEAKGCFQQALTVEPNYKAASEALAAFEEFDRLSPEEQKESAPAMAKDGVRYVPYIEGGKQSDASPGLGDVKQASGTSPANAMPTSRLAGRATRNLQLQSRGMLSGHMQSERNAQSTANAASLPTAR